MSVNRYRSRLERQARGAPVVAINGTPILFVLKNEDEEDNEFINRALRPSSMISFHASANAADARLERKLRYKYAKLTDKGKVRTTQVRYASIEQP